MHSAHHELGMCAHVRYACLFPCSKLLVRHALVHVWSPWVMNNIECKLCTCVFIASVSCSPLKLETFCDYPFRSVYMNETVVGHVHACSATCLLAAQFSKNLYVR